MQTITKEQQKLLNEQNNQEHCGLCRNGHGNLFCDCGHKHDEHVFGVGCRASIVIDGETKKCNCSGYSQRAKNTNYGIVKTALAAINNGSDN